MTKEKPRYATIPVVLLDEQPKFVLNLRALIANGDLDDYGADHIDHEHQRVHKERFAHGLIREP